MVFRAVHAALVGYGALCVAAAWCVLLLQVDAVVRGVVVAGVGAAGIAVWWLANRRADGTAEPMCLLAGLDATSATPATPTTGGAASMCCANGPHYHLYLELRWGQLRVTRHSARRAPSGSEDSEDSAREEDSANPTPALPPFGPAAAVSAVFASPAPWTQAVASWSLATCAADADPTHPAATTYRTVQGPLAITGRRWWLLEVHIDPQALAAGTGTVEAGIAQLAEHIRAHLAHHNVWSVLVDVPSAAIFATRWNAAHAEHRAVATGADAAALATLPPCGDGPIIGADSAERAVCIDLAGPHVHHVLLTGTPPEVAVVLLRQAALGWSGVVITDHPEQWHGPARAMGWPVHGPGTADALTRHPLVGTQSCHHADTGEPTATPFIDVVVWDCTAALPPPLLLAARRAGRARIGTLWEIVPQRAASPEAALQRARAEHPDIVVDARVAGWITVELLTSLPSWESEDVAVQAVTIAEEEQFVRDAAAVPQPEDVLHV